MRGLAVILFVAGCAGNPALERRVTDLEARPAPAKDPTIEQLERRVADLEKTQRRQADELKELQEVVHKLGDQLADALAAQPAPVPSPPAPARRGSLKP